MSCRQAGAGKGLSPPSSAAVKNSSGCSVSSAMACNMCSRGAYLPVSLFTRDRRTVSGSLPYRFASNAARSTWLSPLRFRAAMIRSPTILARSLVVNMWEGFYTGKLPVSSLALAKPKLSRETCGVPVGDEPVMSREEKRALKVWLTKLLPEGMSRKDVADQVDVTTKTISTMLNPEKEAFSKGLTMLRYLQLVGAVQEAPGVSPASSRLAAIEARLLELSVLLRESLESAGTTRAGRPGVGAGGDGVVVCDLSG